MAAAPLPASITGTTASRQKRVFMAPAAMRSCAGWPADWISCQWVVAGRCAGVRLRSRLSLRWFESSSGHAQGAAPELRECSQGLFASWAGRGRRDPDERRCRPLAVDFAG